VVTPEIAQFDLQRVQFEWRRSTQFVMPDHPRIADHHLALFQQPGHKTPFPFTLDRQAGHKDFPLRITAQFQGG